MLIAPTASFDALVDWLRGQGVVAQRMTKHLPEGASEAWVLLRNGKTRTLLKTSSRLPCSHVNSTVRTLGLDPKDFWDTQPRELFSGSYPRHLLRDDD